MEEMDCLHGSFLAIYTITIDNNVLKRKLDIPFIVHVFIIFTNFDVEKF